MFSIFAKHGTHGITVLAALQFGGGVSGGTELPYTFGLIFEYFYYFIILDHGRTVDIFNCFQLHLHHYYIS